MLANRRVLVAVVAAFTLILALGVGWLVRTAVAGQTTPTGAGTSTSDSGEEGVPQETLGAGPESESESESGSGSDGSGSNSNNKAPRPAKTVNVNGPQGGGALEDSCRFFVNQFGITMKIKRVSVSGDDELYRAQDHCPLSTNSDLPSGAEPCESGEPVDAGQACYTGVQLKKKLRLDGDEEDEEIRDYFARVTVLFTGTCESTDVAPCSEEEVARQLPSESRPVRVVWKATTIDLRVRGKTDAEPKPDESSPSPSASASPSASPSSSA